jgi:hypothetical protein
MPIQTIQKSIHITTDTAEKLVSDLSFGILDVLKGVTGGSSNAIVTIANIIDKLGKNISIISKNTASGVGNVSLEVANGLGRVVNKVPLVGGASAYIVKGSGKGVYFVVMVVADVVDKMSTIVGKTAKTTGKVIVFTLGKTEELSEDVVVSTNKLVSTVLGGIKKVVNTKTKKNKLMKSKKSKKQNTRYLKNN